MQTALAQCQIVGVTTNVAFLNRLVSSVAFQSADLDTALIEREQAQLFPAVLEPPRTAWLLAAAAILAREAARTTASPWTQARGWRVGARATRNLLLRAGEVAKTVVVHYAATGWELELDTLLTSARGEFTDITTLQLALGDSRLAATVVASGARQHLYWAEQSWIITTVDPFAPVAAAAADVGHLRSPMPGRIVSLLVEVGAEVAKGTPLLVLEAMKMEHTMLAPLAGRVESFKVAVGEQVPEGIELVVLTG